MHIPGTAGHSNTGQGTAGNTLISTGERTKGSGKPSTRKLQCRPYRFKNFLCKLVSKSKHIFTLISLLKHLPDIFVFTSSLCSTNVLKVNALSHCWLVEREKKNLFLQHHRHQKIRKYGAMKRQQLRKIKVDLLSVSNKKRVLKGSFLPAWKKTIKANSYLFSAEKENHPVLWTDLY